MEKIIHSDYLNQEQAMEIREDFLGVKSLDEAFDMLHKLDAFVDANDSRDRKYDNLRDCLVSIRKVADDKELGQIQTLAFLSASLGVAMVSMLILVGVFSEDDLRIAFADKASLFNQGGNHDA